MQRMMLAAVQVTDKRLIAHQYLILIRISAHLAFSLSTQKDDSHWGPTLDCRAGLVSPFVHKKMNNSTLFITGQLQWQRRHIKCL